MENKKLFRDAFELANRLNKGKEFSLPSVENRYPPSEDEMLLNSRTILLSGAEFDVIDNGISKEYLDFYIKCIGPPIAIKRRFHTIKSKLSSHQDYRMKSGGLLGFGWTIDYEVYCEYDSTNLSIADTSNKRIVFTKSGEDWINISPNSLVKVISENSSKKEISIKKDNYIHVFSFDGHLKRISDLNNNFIEFRYIAGTCLISSIISSCGKKLMFRYKDNKIIQLTDHTGRNIKYFYTDSLLSAFEQANGGKWTFLYDMKNGKLNRVVDPLGKTDVGLIYNRKEFPVFMYFQKYSTWKIEFDERNKKFDFYLSNCSFDMVYQITYSQKFIFSIKYDRQSLIRELTLQNNRVWHFDYNEGLLLSSKENSGKGKYYFEYDKNNLMIYKETPDGNFEKWTRNENGIVTKYLKSNGFESLYEYNKTGKLCEKKIKINKGVTAVIKYSYDAKGRLINRIDPNKNEIKYIYKSDDSILPELTYYPNNFCLERGYDQLGRLIYENELGVEKRFKYNNMDKCVEISVNNTYKELRRYDLLGNLIEITSPKDVEYSKLTNEVSKKYRYKYDENYELVNIELPSGKQAINIVSNSDTKKDKAIGEILKYDFAGNITEKWIPSSKDLYNVILYAYDKNQNKIQEKISYTESHLGEYPLSYLIIDYKFDSRNNICQIHKSTGEDRKLFYIGINRLVREISKINEITEQTVAYEYNEFGLLKQKVDYLDLNDTNFNDYEKSNSETSYIKIITVFKYNENGKLIRIILPNAEILELTYDCDGEMLNPIAFEEKQNMKNIGINIFDKNNRLIKKIYPDEKYELFEYDFAGNISMFTDKDGKSTFFRYNSINRLKEKIDANGIKTEFLYGADGEINGTK